MRDLRAMGETNVMRDRLRRPTPRARCWRAPRRSTPSASATPDGRVRATFEVIFLTGWAPVAGPAEAAAARARRGSRLADALGAAERAPAKPACAGD